MSYSPANLPSPSGQNPINLPGSTTSFQIPQTQNQLIQRMFIENSPWLIQVQKATAGGDNPTSNSIVSTTFAVFPQKPLHLNVNSNGGNWFIFVQMPVVARGTTFIALSIAIDGIEVTTKSNGLAYQTGLTVPALIFWSQIISSGTHTIDAVAKVDAGTGFIYSDTNSQINLWAVEVK